jgi:hypothetical protein
VQLQFSADTTVAFAGFMLSYMDANSSASSTIPCPGLPACSSSGACKSGECSCFAGFVGESCNNVALCPSDISSCQVEACDPLCLLDQDSVIAVSIYGSDTEGTGKRMDTSPAGKSPKAVRSLRQALNIATSGQLIALYPGTFEGTSNCDLQFTLLNLTIRGIGGSDVTRVDCSSMHSGFTVTSDELHLHNVTLANMKAQSGSAINIIDGVLIGHDLHIVGGASSANGGGITALRSSVSLVDSSVRNCTAEKGGAIFLDSSNVVLDNTRISSSFAKHGAGIYAQNQVTISGNGRVVVAQNNASIAGGGILASGLTEIEGLRIEHNSGVAGAGLAVTAASTTLVNLIIEQNFATKSGGGVAVLNAAALEVVTSTITSNIAVFRGGGVFSSSSGSVQFDDTSAIFNCSAGAFDMHDYGNRARN